MHSRIFQGVLRILVSLVLAGLMGLPGQSPDVAAQGANRSFLPIVTNAPTPPGFFVAPNGRSSGNGSVNNPWDLQTALNHPSAVKPGATIWVRGGTYNYRHLDALYSRLKGASGKPITVRAYPGERAVIDAPLSVHGEWAIFRDLEFTDSTPHGSVRKDAIAVWGPHIWLINNVIHDSGGVGFWWQSEGSEMYGNIIYNIGSLVSGKGRGHGIYTTNNTGTKVLKDNIVFNTYSGYTFHAYSEQTYLNNFVFEGNVSFNGRFQVGGTIPARNITLIDNYMYRGPMYAGFSSSVTNQNLTMTGNVFDAEGEETLVVKQWDAMTVTGNQVRSEGGGVMTYLQSPGSHGAYSWNGNTYYADGSQPFYHNGDVQTFNEWKSSTGFDRNSSLGGKPTGTRVIVRANQYEPGRGHVIVYNWDQRDSVSVDLSSLGLRSGERYVLRNAQNYFAEAISGTYTGKPVTIPMKTWSVAPPRGIKSPLRPSTFPEFGVFVVTRE